MRGPAVSFGVVVPTTGRACLAAALGALEAAGCPAERFVVVDDRRSPSRPIEVPAGLASRSVVLHGGGRGPAAARNAGWRALESDWAVFVDDDVVPAEDWPGRLADDLAGAARDVAGVQGRLTVPLPAQRRPTDWERNVAGLESAAYATADMAFRVAALEACGGFDERFPRAYREDADLARRLRSAGWRVVVGARRSTHPVGPSRFFTSVRIQRNNADDARLRALHGAGWRQACATGAGRNRRHGLVVAGALAGVVGAAAGNRGLSRAGALAAAAGELELCAARITPGPRSPCEIARMVATSAALPFAALGYRLAGELAVRREGPPGRALWRGPAVAPAPIQAVLFDRDGTLVEDVPYNGDPDEVRPITGAGDAVRALRAAGLRLGIVTNQSGIARGILDEVALGAVHARLESLLGPFDTWQVCPHDEAAGCPCRKPAPGLVEAAAADLGVDPASCIVVGDVASDLAAAAAAGAGAILVPAGATRREELAGAPAVAGSLPAATGLLLAARRHRLPLGRQAVARARR